MLTSIYKYDKTTNLKGHLEKRNPSSFVSPLHPLKCVKSIIDEDESLRFFMFLNDRGVLFLRFEIKHAILLLS